MGADSLPDRGEREGEYTTRVVAEFLMPGPGDSLHADLATLAERHGGELDHTADRALTAPVPGGGQTDPYALEVVNELIRRGSDMARERDRLAGEVERQLQELRHRDDVLFAIGRALPDEDFETVKRLLLEYETHVHLAPASDEKSLNTGETP